MMTSRLSMKKLNLKYVFDIEINKMN